MTLIERIVKWNRDRNGLDFDPSLELKMLSEEANEFFMASEPAHVLQEFSDFRFVKIGTKIKYYSQIQDSTVRFSMTHNEWKTMSEWINETSRHMYERLAAVFPTYTGPDMTVLLEFGLEAVTSANEAKGTEKGPDGKVVKGPDYVSPIERIRNHIS